MDIIFVDTDVGESKKMACVFPHHVENTILLLKIEDSIIILKLSRVLCIHSCSLKSEKLSSTYILTDT